MSKIHESFKENQKEILAALPEEFHADFLKELEMPMFSSEPMSEEQEIEAIKAELIENPSVNEHLAADELKEISAPSRIAPITDEEAKATEAELLAEVKASMEGNS